MLTRLYVDNYRCLVDFEFKPKQAPLLLGVSGIGKSRAVAARRAELAWALRPDPPSNPASPSCY